MNLVLNFEQQRIWFLVLIIEALGPSFGKTFWKFIEDGGYENRQEGTGENQFHRFTEQKSYLFQND